MYRDGRGDDPLSKLPFARLEELASSFSAGAARSGSSAKSRGKHHDGAAAAIERLLGKGRGGVLFSDDSDDDLAGLLSSRASGRRSRKRVHTRHSTDPDAELRKRLAEEERHLSNAKSFLREQRSNIRERQASLQLAQKEWQRDVLNLGGDGALDGNSSASDAIGRLKRLREEKRALEAEAELCECFRTTRGSGR